MIPSYESMAKQAIVRVFNTIMTRAGITLIVTVAFSISSMFYNISTDYPFFMVAFLQIVCFAGIYMKLGDLMSMFSLNANDSQSMGRRIFRRPYLYLAHRARRMEHRIARAVSAGAVSYTHLDVYKRQAEVCARYHTNAGRSATSIVATDSVFLF